ncbi:MAG: hypothetical protein Q8L98_00080 [Chlamydiales bacterium]|nr:hypothetical protein [Chlamydiales bacterium]
MSEVYLSSVEAEREKVKRLQREMAEMQPLAKVTNTSLDTFAISSIGPSSSEGKSPQFRPDLPPLDSSYSNPIPRFLACLNDYGELSHDTFDLLEMEAEGLPEFMDRLHAKLIQDIQEETATNEIEGKWHTLETVFQYAVAAGSLLKGLQTIFQKDKDTGAGAVWLAAGGLGLTNQIMTDTKGWEAIAKYFANTEEKQREIAARIQAGMFLLSLGLTVYSGVWAFKTGQLLDALPKEKLKIVTLAVTLLQGGTKLVGGSLKYRSSGIGARIIRTQAEITDCRKTLGLCASSEQELLDVALQISEVVKKAIQHLSVSE